MSRSLLQAVATLAGAAALATGMKPMPTGRKSLDADPDDRDRWYRDTYLKRALNWGDTPTRCDEKALARQIDKKTDVAARGDTAKQILADQAAEDQLARRGKLSPSAHRRHRKARRFNTKTAKKFARKEATRFALKEQGLWKGDKR